MKLLAKLSFAVVLLVHSLYSLAGEDALYKTPPPGSSFVRIFNLQQSTPIASANLAGVNINQVEGGTVSDFIFVDAKTNSITIDQKSFPVTLQEGKFHTLVFNGTAVKVVDIDPVTDKRKALVHLINLTDTPLDLKTVKGDVAVIPDVKPYASGARGINPVKIAFGVYAGGTKLMDTPEIFLGRGASGSFIVYKSGKDAKMVWTEDGLSSEK